MMEERYHATKQNRFYRDMSSVNKNITVEARLVNTTKYISKQKNRTVSYHFIAD